ncbi:response regulator [Spirosoma agri]|uniref:Response regulator n=1 Tax=Spirosoma agri TaxID=1987381 RepID=A0A6M0IRV2_9BACT|nr:response regulator [Spirosoma agri]NEU70657.1 response regulator [Spirosoma agri]
MPNTLTPSKANLRNAKVLVIEDNDDQWLLIQQAMSHCMSGVTAQRTANLTQTVALIESWHYQEWEYPKLILMDLYLPASSDGWELLKQIKATSTAIGKIPVVVLTVSTDRADIGQAYQLGASAYVVKPIEFTDWLTLFRDLRTYWWETATLPPTHYGF